METIFLDSFVLHVSRLHHFTRHFQHVAPRGCTPPCLLVKSRAAFVPSSTNFALIVRNESIEKSHEEGRDEGNMQAQARKSPFENGTTWRQPRGGRMPG
mmetsp:Transcript_1063/g.6780  ORF Transcript_1063/g.6780 Transcript_1063/m.6780 type:complete len:99 (+) Transcript_1063:1-297(+)